MDIPRKATKAEAGKKGGETTRDRHGREHYVKAGKLGFAASARNHAAGRKGQNLPLASGPRQDDRAPGRHAPGPGAAPPAAHPARHRRKHRQLTTPRHPRGTGPRGASPRRRQETQPCPTRRRIPCPRDSLDALAEILSHAEALKSIAEDARRSADNALDKAQDAAEKAKQLFNLLDAYFVERCQRGDPEPNVW